MRSKASRSSSESCDGTAMPSKNWEYDVFISYSRSDAAWVEEHLYGPLSRCRKTVDGAPPRVFFDVSAEGVAPAANFMNALATALQASHRIVLVYSNSYFEKEWCRWEMNLAVSLDPMGAKGRVVPVLKDREAEGSVPFMVSVLNFVPVTSDDWFSKLRTALDLNQSAVPVIMPTLRFVKPAAAAQLNGPLGPVTVALEGIDTQAGPVEVVLSAQGGSLQGTLRRPIEGDAVVFDDVAVADAGDTVHLVAEVEGLASATSPPIAVTRPEVAAAPTRSSGVLSIADATYAAFLRDGTLMAALSDAEAVLARVDDAGGIARCASIALGGPVRRLFRGRDIVLVAQWDGALHLLSADGRTVTWSPPDDGGMHVPGEAIVGDDRVLVGYWDGSVYDLGRCGESPIKTLHCAAGVRKLSAAKDLILVIGFDTTLRAYRNGSLANTWHLEDRILALWVRHPHVLAIGEARIHRLDLETKSVLSEPVDGRGVAGVLADTARPLVVGPDGRVVRFDADVVKAPRFYVPPGSLPIGADDDGRVCVFELPDGTRSLVIDGRRVLDRPTGCLAVSPDGRRFALSDSARVSIVAREDLESTSQEEVRHV